MFVQYITSISSKSLKCVDYCHFIENKKFFRQPLFDSLFLGIKRSMQKEMPVVEDSKGLIDEEELQRIAQATPIPHEYENEPPLR